MGRESKTAGRPSRGGRIDHMRWKKKGGGQLEPTRVSGKRVEKLAVRCRSVGKRKSLAFS